jgi:hypothetical protein
MVSTYILGCGVTLLNIMFLKLRAVVVSLIWMEIMSGDYSFHTHFTIPSLKIRKMMIMFPKFKYFGWNIYGK